MKILIAILFCIFTNLACAAVSIQTVVQSGGGTDTTNFIFQTVAPAPSPAEFFPTMLLGTNFGYRVNSSNYCLFVVDTKTSGTGNQPDTFDFWTSTGGAPTLPAGNTFTVTVGGVPNTVNAVDAVRWCAYSENEHYNPFVIYTRLHFQLASATLTNGAVVAVTTNAGNTAFANLSYSFNRTLAIDDFNPAIQVNQLGYFPSTDWPKVFTVSYYLGTNMMEASFASGTAFNVYDVDGASNIYSGTLAAAVDTGWTVTPAPYQSVMKGDFTSVTKEGLYEIRVANAGRSVQFRIDRDVPYQIAVMAEKGLYTARCGSAIEEPYSSWTHLICHTNVNRVMTNTAEFHWTTIIDETENGTFLGWGTNAACLLTNGYASLYTEARPVNQTPRSVIGGHHDAGDFSIYCQSIAHGGSYLLHAVDVYTGVGNLDNLGIPESGNGIPDLLDECKRDFDVLLGMQDTDGGVADKLYPHDRKYENGDPGNFGVRVIQPKNTLNTFATVGALAEAGSSPAMKKFYPTDASNYLAKALLGYTWCTNMEAVHGVTNSYQPIHHYGHIFGPADEKTWALTALAVADTNNFAHYMNAATNWTPSFAGTTLWKDWNWWPLWEGYGKAQLNMVFAVKLGKIPQTMWTPYQTYWNAVTNNLQLAYTTNITRAAQCAFGTPFQSQSKNGMTTPYYFGGKMIQPTIEGYEMQRFYGMPTSSAALNTVVGCFDFEWGRNPQNLGRAAGISQNPSTVTQSQWPRFATPIKFGAQTGFLMPSVVENYSGGLRATDITQVTWPPFGNGAQDEKMPLYNRISNCFNVNNGENTYLETSQHAASAAWIAGMACYQPGPQASLVFSPAPTLGDPCTITADAPGIDTARLMHLYTIGSNQIYGVRQPTWIPVKTGSTPVLLEIKAMDGTTFTVNTNITVNP